MASPGTRGKLVGVMLVEAEYIIIYIFLLMLGLTDGSFLPSANLFSFHGVFTKAWSFPANSKFMLSLEV